MLRTPPFRAPHHTVSRAGLIGGGSPLQPGEVSLAHNGVLFLDEAPEFKRDLLDALRQPLEEAEVAVVRVAQRVTYPARFQLVLAMNPCPCGHFLTSPNRCRCPQRVVDRYLGRISGPLLDRIDIQIQLEAVAPAALGGQPDPSGTTQSLCEAVGQARERQHARGGLNAQLSDKLMQGAARLTEAARSCLNVCAGDQELSPRGYYRMVRLARTVADLEGSERIQPDHVLQAVMLRCSAGI